ENAGQHWRTIKVSDLPGVPVTAFVNDIKADLFDVNTVYVVLDNHKFGDLDPYIFKSTDKGKTWQSIRSNLPLRNIAWRVVQDHIKPDLLFAATEFGIWFTYNGGKNWIQLKGNLPVISFRDLVIQRRENDLIAASFGRGFFILDDYAVLRSVSDDQMNRKASLFPLRHAWWYIPRQVLSNNQKASQGDAYFVADNPPFGAVFTYHLCEDIKSPEKIRKEAEKELKRQNQDIPFPGWKEVEMESRASEPKIWLMIKDKQGEIVGRVEGPVVKGFHRVAWDLKVPSTAAMRATASEREPRGPMVSPGEYTVELFRQTDGQFVHMAGPETFEVRQMRKGVLQGASANETVAFWKEIQEMRKATSAASLVLTNAMQKLDLMEKALACTPVDPAGLLREIHNLNTMLFELDEEMNGNRSKQKVGEDSNPTVNDRLNFANLGTANSTYGPTPSHRRSLEIAWEQFAELRNKLEEIRTVQLPAIEKALAAAGAPWIEGQVIPGK
ncbi:MAG: hypothetical protein U1C46_00105, partial [Bacteroidales bacterium]|nr:hypothetical protein [Bacteroidales bacterium]